MRIKLSKNGSSFKNSPNFESEKELCEKLDLSYVVYYDLMVKRKLQGDEVYAYIDPCIEEIDGERVLYWEPTQAGAEIEFLNSAENI